MSVCEIIIWNDLRRAWFYWKYTLASAIRVNNLVDGTDTINSRHLETIFDYNNYLPYRRARVFHDKIRVSSCLQLIQILTRVCNQVVYTKTFGSNFRFGKWCWWLSWGLDIKEAVGEQVSESVSASEGWSAHCHPYWSTLSVVQSWAYTLHATHENLTLLCLILFSQSRSSLYAIFIYNVFSWNLKCHVMYCIER